VTALRAAFVYPTLTVGGADRQLALLVRELRERQIDSTIVTLKHEGRFFHELRDDGFPVSFAAMRTRADARGARRAAETVRRAGPDVVVTQSVDAQVIGHWIARRLHVPHVTIEHGGPGLRRAFHRRVLVRLVAPHVDQAIAIAAAQVPTLRAFGFRSDRIVVIPNGSPEPHVLRARDVVRAELGVGPGDTVALLAATLRPEKRATLFVEAVAHARDRLPSLRGVVAGGGPDLEAARGRAAALEGTVVLGERDDVADLISAADLVCLTSVAEGLPMIVLEAMALARPVVSTAVGGIPDVVTPDLGLLVDDGTPAAIGDALVSLATDPDRRRAMGLAARASYEASYTVGRMADDYAAVLRRLVEETQTTSPRRRRFSRPRSARRVSGE
jgi:glycosyltransferase involved in cell wall biosynthesis